MKILYRKVHDGFEFFQHEGSEIKEVAKIEVRLFTLNRNLGEDIIEAFRQATKDYINDRTDKPFFKMEMSAQMQKAFIESAKEDDT